MKINLRRNEVKPAQKQSQTCAGIESNLRRFFLRPAVP